MAGVLATPLVDFTDFGDKLEINYNVTGEKVYLDTDEMELLYYLLREWNYKYDKTKS